MNIAQHLMISTLILLSLVAQAQNTPQPAEEAKVEEASVDESSSQQETPAEEVPPPSSGKSLLKTAANSQFNKPLYFDQLDNGVVLLPMELDYDLTSGSELKVGNVSLNEKNFFFALLPLEKAYSQLSKVLSDDEKGKVSLVMAWPENLIDHGTLEMISRTGAVLWSYSFGKEERSEWAQKQTQWRKNLIAKGAQAKDLSRAGIFRTQFAIVDVASAKAPFWGQKETFRFCLTKTEGRNSTKLCSQRYGVKSSGKNVSLAKVRVEKPTPRVLVNNEDAPLKKIVPVSSEMPTSFFAELASGESYEFVTIPNKLQLMDISEVGKANQLRIVAYDTRPTGRSVILNPDQYGSLTKLLGFEATIGDPRKFWMTLIDKNDPKVYLPGQGGGIFKQRFELSEIPRTQSRVYLHKNAPTGTYIDGVKIEGRKQPSSKIASEQNKVEVNPADSSLFVWNFRATERGKINRSYLNVEFEGKNYKSYYEIYKGFPREFSGRFSGVQASSEFIIMGEVAYNQWFEDLFGWDNYWMSRQRWGVSAKYFQSANQLTVDDAGNKANLLVLTVDMKYRATPGLWGRDESVGGILSYQNVEFDRMKAPMLGVGAFWARSMPRVFDDLFNYIPFLRYPKWVDMEFLYYASSMDANVTLNSPLSLNFHGKILWTDRFFGEAGFGLKRYGFQDSSLNQKAELNTFYGTAGLGINF